MAARVTITIEGVETVLSNLETIGKKIESNIQDITATLGADALDVMRERTHVRTGQLREGNTLNVGHFSFTLSNRVRWARFIEFGHMTPRGWRTKHGYRSAKRRSQVGPYPFLEPAVEFVDEVILERLGKAVSD